MSNNKILLSKYKITNIIFSFCLALIVALIPWEVIRSTEYRDLSAYINYINNYENRIYWFDYSTLTSKISYEWGWHYFVDLLNNKLGFSGKYVLLVVSLFILNVTFLLISSTKNKRTCFLVLNPIYIDFAYSQVRSAFAVAIIILSIMAFRRNKLLSLIILIPAFFIHTASFVFVFIFYSAFLTNKYLKSQNKKFLIAVFVGLISSIITGPYMSVLLGLIEDRREDYKDLSSPIIYMSFWIILFLFFLIKFLSGKIKNLDNYYFYLSISILSMIFINVFLSGYSSRFLAAAMPFLILTISDLRGKYESLVVIGYIFFAIILWIFWLI